MCSDSRDSSRFCLIQLAKGQQGKGGILLASSGSGWDTECYNSGRGSFLTSRVILVTTVTSVGGQSQSSLHTQAHSSWCSKGTSVNDFCRPLPPFRYFSSSTCQHCWTSNILSQARSDYRSSAILLGLWFFILFFNILKKYCSVSEFCSQICISKLR